MAHEPANGRPMPRALGSLESQIMARLWETSQDLSVRDVCDALGPHHNYKTVMTVLNRLVEKGLLERRLDGRAFWYHPRMSRPQFLQAVSHDMVQGFVQTYGEAEIVHVADAMTAVAPQYAAAPAAPPQPAASSMSSPPPVASYAATLSRPRLSPVARFTAVVAAIQAFLYFRSRRKRH